MANLKAIDAWSSASSAANENTDAPLADYATGLNAAVVKEKFRGLKASVAASWKDVLYGVATGGTSTAYTVTCNRTLDTYFDGLVQAIIPNANCGANPTLSLNAIGAKDIKTQTGGAINADDLVSGAVYTVRYNLGEDEFRLSAPTAAEITDLIQALFGAASDVWTGTSTKTLTGDALRDAGAAVSVTMDNAMDLDLSLGRNFFASATVNTNSTITLTNDVAGDVVAFYFTIDGTNRTFTFESGSVTPGGFTTLTKEFTASTNYLAMCFVRATGVYIWTFLSDVKAAA